MPEREGNAAAILRLLREAPQQAQDLAATLRIDTSAARRHLENLRAEGLVESEDAIEGPGRPKKRYRLTAQGRETFRRDYALVLGLVLAKLRDRGGESELEATLKEIAGDLAAAIAKLPADERLPAVVRFYNELGFEAAAEEAPDGTIRFTQRNCILLRTAESDPRLLCQVFDEGILRAALPGAKIELAGSLATGAHLCTHVIRLRSRASRA